MSQRRVLLVRTGAMGDVLHALPAAAALRALWPETKVDWLVEPRWAPLLVNKAGQGPVVSRVEFAATAQWSRHPLSLATLHSVMALWRKLAAERYGTVVDLQGTLRSAVLGRMTGARARTGFSDPRERLARTLYTQACKRQGSHVVEQNAALLGDALGVTLQPQLAPLPLDDEAETWAEQVCGNAHARGPQALLVPSAGWGAKQWPAARFGELAQRLATDMGLRVLVNASGEQDAVAAAAVEAAAGTAERVIGDVARLIALTRRMTVVVGGDTGPVHLAAALGRPLVALFGPTDPVRNGPWGTGPMRVLRDIHSVTTYRRTVTTHPGLESMSVPCVLDAVRSVIPSQGAS